jgi:transposase
MNFKLSDSDRALLREIQQNEKHKKNYVKVTILLGLDKGNSPEALMDLLGISSSTFYRYVSHFKEAGLEDYLENHYLGYWGKLDSFQLAALQEELSTNFYTDSQAIADWIWVNFGV